MEKLSQVLPHITSYQPALIALLILCLAVLIQGFLAGAIGLGKDAEVPGVPLKGDHKDFAFRTLRTYGNSVENLPVFAIVLFLAVVAGAAPAWVNWLAGIHVAIRLVYWAVYYSGIGKVGGGPRTMTYVAGWLANLVLAVVTLFALM